MFFGGRITIVAVRAKGLLLYTGKLSWLVHKITIRGKTFTVHQAVAIMYCTQQVIQGKNFSDRLKNREKRESFPVHGKCLTLLDYR